MLKCLIGLLSGINNKYFRIAFLWIGEEMLKEIYKLGELTLRKKYIEQEYERHTLVDLFWECTLTCNAKCKHCGSSAEKKKYDGELTTEEIKAALKQVADDMDATKILINVTGGEPLVRKDLCEVMEYATNELGFRWGMTTNGILLNDENIEKLKKANMETISISIDGLEQTHDSFRGVPSSYKKIISNIKKLLNFIKEKRKNSKLELMYGCPSFLGLKYEKEVRNHYFYCKTGINVASILYNGDLFVCPNVPRRKELIQGNVRTDNFKDVWDNKYKQLRNKERTKCSSCEKCENWEYCLGGSFHTWNFEDNSQNKCVYKM